MKKTILALAVSGLFAATTAQAATVYEAEGVTLDVYGDLEVLYFNDKAKDSEQDGIIALDDADFGFKMGYKLDNGATVGGVLEFSGENQNENGLQDDINVGNVRLGDAFVGVSYENMGTFTAGKQATIYDDAGIGADYQFGFTTFYEQGVDSGYQVLKYQGDWDMFYAGIAYMLASDQGTTTADSWVDGKLGLRLGGFDLTAFYGQGDAAETTNKDGDPTLSVSQMTLEGRYSFDNVGIAITGASSDNGADTLSDTTSYGASADWNIGGGASTIAAGLASIDNDAVDDTRLDYYASYSYRFSSNVNTYLEVGGSDADETELGYALGMQVTF